jgi:Sec-independent protein translocase protein TatA
MGLGTTEILIIVGAALMLFGAPKVVHWAKALGQAKREYHRAENGEYDSANSGANTAKTTNAATTVNEPNPKTG